MREHWPRVHTGGKEKKNPKARETWDLINKKDPTVEGTSLNQRKPGKERIQGRKEKKQSGKTWGRGKTLMGRRVKTVGGKEKRVGEKKNDGGNFLKNKIRRQHRKQRVGADQ